MAKLAADNLLVVNRQTTLLSGDGDIGMATLATMLLA
jgi:hypothetical protein